MNFSRWLKIKIGLGIRSATSPNCHRSGLWMCFERQVFLHTVAKVASECQVRMHAGCKQSRQSTVTAHPLSAGWPRWQQVIGWEEKRVRDSATTLEAGGGCQGKATWRNDIKRELKDYKRTAFVAPRLLQVEEGMGMHLGSWQPRRFRFSSVLAVCLAIMEVQQLLSPALSGWVGREGGMEPPLWAFRSICWARWLGGRKQRRRRREGLWSLPSHPPCCHAAATGRQQGNVSTCLETAC